jgi:hypothetical protein
VQIKQYGYAKPLPHLFEHIGDGFVIRSVERQYAVLHIIQSKLPFPQFTLARQSSGNKAKTAALLDPWRRIITAQRPLHHFCVNILLVAVQINPRPRTVRHNDRVAQRDTAPRQYVGISVLKPQ